MFKNLKDKLFKKKHRWIHNKSAGIFKEDIHGRVSISKTDKSIFWNLDTSLAALIRDWLRMFAKETKCYPFYDDIDDVEDGYERWKTDLLKTADLLNDYLIEPIYDIESERKSIETMISEYDTLDQKHEIIERIEQDGNEEVANGLKVEFIQVKRIKSALSWLGEHWCDLWW